MVGYNHSASITNDKQKPKRGDQSRGDLPATANKSPRHITRTHSYTGRLHQGSSNSNRAPRLRNSKQQSPSLINQSPRRDTADLWPNHRILGLRAGGRAIVQERGKRGRKKPVAMGALFQYARVWVGRELTMVVCSHLQALSRGVYPKNVDQGNLIR